MTMKRLWTPKYPRCPNCKSFDMIKKEIGTVEEHGISRGRPYVWDLDNGSIKFPEHAYMGDYVHVNEYRCLDCGHKEYDSLTYYETKPKGSN